MTDAEVIEQAKAEMKIHGGWIINEEEYLVVVLDGPYFGSWSILKDNNQLWHSQRPWVYKGSPTEEENNARVAELFKSWGMTRPANGLDYKLWGLVYLANIAGLSREEFIEAYAKYDGNAEAGRFAANLVKRFPVGSDERRDFAIRFFQSWDPYKALPEWCKRVEKWKQILREDLSWNLRPFSILKSLPENWHQNVEVYQNNPEYDNDLVELGVTDVVDHRAIYRHWNQQLRDTLRLANRFPEGMLMAHRGGREYMADRLAGRWGKIARHHDALTDILNEEKEAIIALQNAEAAAFHSGCPWEDTDLVKVLRTVRDFCEEGEAMGHCAGAYFPHTTSYVVSINVDGVRSTAEVTPHLSVKQFVGKRNGPVPAGHQKILDKWLEDQRKMTADSEAEAEAATYD